MTDDVSRVFQRLVEVLADRGQARLREPIELADLYQKIIPYRTHRVALRFDSNQDYEMALLRLLAGEQGYVEVDPPEVAQALAEEARSINPNPGAFRAFSQATARLSFKAVTRLLEARAPYAPPDASPASPPAPASGWGAGGGAGRAGGTPERVRDLPFDLVPAPPAAPASPAQGAKQENCPQCSGRLPASRAVNFCPHCGGNVNVRDCPQCGTQLDLEWRHCVSCGYRVA